MAPRVRALYACIRKVGPAQAIAMDPALVADLLRDLARIKVAHPARYAVLRADVLDELLALL